MREIIIQGNDSGQRLDKFLRKYLREAGSGFIYKMLRRKNIKLNGKKAEGKEMLSDGDRVCIYFSDETLRKFRGEDILQVYPVKKLSVIYEDEDIVLINKPAGMLSQRAKKDDTSLVEYFIGYLQSKGEWENGQAFMPGICNRLDRNTSGLVIAGKSLRGLQKMSELLKERRIGKNYLAVVEGVMTEAARIKGYLEKDGTENRVKIYEDGAPGRSYIETGYEPAAGNDRYTLLRVRLITGKTHQIRAHLGSIGHPLAGDIKYGGSPLSGVSRYLLHAEEIRFPDLPEPFQAISGRCFQAPLPAEFDKICKKLF